MNRVVNPVIENTLAPDVTDSVNPLAVWMHVAGVVWLIGVAVFLIFAVVSYVRLRRQVRFAARFSGNVWQCDEKVIKTYDMNEKKAYSGALLAMSMNRRQMFVCPLAFGEVGVKERVKSVLHYKKPAFWMLASAVLACVVVAVCFLTDPKEETKTMDELGYSNANVWYVSELKCDLLGNSGDASIYPGTFHLYELSNIKMFCFDSGWGGSGSVTQAWVFDSDGAKEVENVLEGISQLSENEFMVTSSAYDGSADGTGHTWNRYFSRWDGEKLVEYGGLKISEEQLRKAKHADEILDDVKAYGEIQSIYYRANGMVFINLSDGLRNRNVALTLAEDVKARLETEGYQLSDVTYDEGFERMVKEEYPLWQDAGLYPYGSDDTWVVFSRYDATVEWGSRLDALADTLVVRGESMKNIENNT